MPAFRSFLFAAVSFPLIALAHGPDDHDVWKPSPYADKLAHAPKPLPDRIVLTWAGDTATTQAVTWRTDPSIVRAVAEIALANDNGRALQATSVPARTEDFTSDLGEAHYHSVNFTGLQPDTLYAYRVGDGANWSEWFHFRTASREAKPFTFVYFGDAQNDIKMHWSRVFREAFRDAPRAAFTLHAGDLINNANNDAQWGEWFGAPAWVNGTIPVIATPGNHEYFNRDAGLETDRRWTTKDGRVVRMKVDTHKEQDAAGATTGYRTVARIEDGKSGTLRLDADKNITAIDPGITALTGYVAADLVGVPADKKPLNDRLNHPGTPSVSRHWRPQFTFPEQNVPAGLEETCYYLDYQGTRIVSLDSMQQHDEQAVWLRAVLKNNPQRWTVVTFHHPVFSPARNRDNPELRARWKPILDEYKVDLVLTGHDHTYARSGDVARGVGSVNVPAGYNQVYDPAIGTVYVVSVSGPKMYNITQDVFVRTAEDTQLYQIIDIAGDELRYQARTATGRLYDAFVLKKRTGQPNELRETLPPENRRESSASEEG